MQKMEKHLEVSRNEMTAIDLLAENTDFSRQKIKQVMQKGAVWLTQKHSTKRIRRASKKLKTGQILHLYYDASILSQSSFKAELIADEKDFSVWCKPAGMLSQGSKYGDHCALYRWVETQIQPQRNAFIVHRLDKATMGLILVAHSKHAATALSQLFHDHQIKKYYQALVHGCLKDNVHNETQKISTLSLPITIDEALEGKPATTRILSSKICLNKPYSLLELQILTGRKHQIRQHLSKFGHPVVGDRLYGSGVKDKQDLCLTAYKLSFISPFDDQEKHYELESRYYPSCPPVKTNLNAAEKNNENS